MKIRAVAFAAAASILAAAVLASCASHPTLEIRAASKDPVQGGVKTEPPVGNAPLYVLPQVVVTDADVAWAKESTDARGNRAVSIWFTPEGARKVQEYTQAHVDQPIAIFVNGKLCSAPIVRSPLKDVAMITERGDGMSGKQQRDLIAALNAGKLRPEGMR